MNQVKSSLQQGYRLKQNLDRIEEYSSRWEDKGAADAILIDELPEQKNLDFVFTDPEQIDSINEIRLEGLLSDIENLDYILTRPNLPVMSKRMLSVLESVKDFSHQVIPVVIEDMEMAFFGSLERSGKVNTDYVAVQLLEQLDIFDRENSVYSPNSISPHGVGRIRRLVLKVPPQGLPPIFRIIENSTYLYVSPEAKAALEGAGITGIRFVPID